VRAARALLMLPILAGGAASAQTAGPQPCAVIVSRVTVPEVTTYGEWRGVATGKVRDSEIARGSRVELCAPNKRLRLRVGTKMIWIDSFAVETQGAERGGAPVDRQLRALPPPPGNAAGQRAKAPNLAGDGRVATLDPPDAEAWQKAAKENSLARYTEYLRQFPNGLHREEAKRRVEEIGGGGVLASPRSEPAQFPVATAAASPPPPQSAREPAAQAASRPQPAPPSVATAASPPSQQSAREPAQTASRPQPAPPSVTTAASPPSQSARISTAPQPAPALAAASAGHEESDPVRVPVTPPAPQSGPPPAGGPMVAALPPPSAQMPTVSLPAPAPPPPLATAAVPRASVRPDNISLRRGIDFPGGDFSNHRDVTLDQCKSLCARSSQCVAFSYVESKRWCWLKDRLNAPRREAEVISGTKF